MRSQYKQGAKKKTPTENNFGGDIREIFDKFR